MQVGQPPCMLQLLAPTNTAHAVNGSPLLHPGLSLAPCMLPHVGTWEHPQQQQQQQQPACFVPTAAAHGSADGTALVPAALPVWAHQQAPGGLLSMDLLCGKQQDRSQDLELEQEEQQQPGFDDTGGAGKKSRLRWNSQLHSQFVAAVEQLGGAFTATPKRILAAMCMPGLTLFHVKSHLQKYRNALGGGPGGSKRRGGGLSKKRNAANMRGGSCSRGPGSSHAGSGASSDAEEEEGQPLELGGSLQEAAASAGDYPAECQHRSKRASSPELLSALPPTLPSALPPPVPVADSAGDDGLLGSGFVLSDWDSAPDLEAIDDELAAVLAPAGELVAMLAGPPGNVLDSEQLLDLPHASIQLLERELSQELGSNAETAASPAPATAAPTGAAAATFAAEVEPSDSATHAHSAGRSYSGTTGGLSSGSGGQRSVAASPVLPAASLSAAAGTGGTEHGLLQAALKMQVEMQRQLSKTIEAQRALQQQMASHGKYIEDLLRSEEGPLLSRSSRPAAAPAPGAKARSSGGRRSSKSGSGGGPARTQPASLQPLPPQCAFQEAEPMCRSDSAPALFEQAPVQPARPTQQPRQQSLPLPPLPPLVLQPGQPGLGQAALPPAPALPSPAPVLAPRPPAAQFTAPSFHLEQRFLQQQLELERHYQDRQLALAREAEQQRRQLEQQQEQEAAAAALSPEDVDLLLAADLPGKEGLGMEEGGEEDLNLGLSLQLGTGPHACAAAAGVGEPADGGPAVQQQQQPDRQELPKQQQQQQQQQQQHNRQHEQQQQHFQAAAGAGWASSAGIPAVQPTNPVTGAAGPSRMLPLLGSQPACAAFSHASCATNCCTSAVPGASPAAPVLHSSSWGAPPAPATTNAPGSVREEATRGCAASAAHAGKLQPQLQLQLRQPGPPLHVPPDSELLDAEMWDSLLTDSGVMEGLFGSGP